MTSVATPDATRLVIAAVVGLVIAMPVFFNAGLIILIPLAFLGEPFVR